MATIGVAINIFSDYNWMTDMHGSRIITSNQELWWWKSFCKGAIWQRWSLLSIFYVSPVPVMLHRLFTFLLYLFSHDLWITMRAQFSCCFCHFLVTKVHSWNSFKLFSCSLLCLYFNWLPAHSLSLLEYILKPATLRMKLFNFSSWNCNLIPPSKHHMCVLHNHISCIFVAGVVLSWEFIKFIKL